MEQVKIFLQGPGGELRPVHAMEPDLRSHIKASSLDAPVRMDLRGIGRVFDSEGRVAVQADIAGLLYRYEEQGPTWALLIG